MISIALLTIMSFACETPLTNIPPSKLPQTESKLVVNAIISPQLAYINVVVTESIPLFSETDATEERVADALVRISDGVNEVVIPYDAENKLYSIPKSKFPIKDSKTYYLFVSDKTRSATAQCSVPGRKPEIKSYQLDTMVVSNTFGQDTILTLQTSWQDIPSDTNYYKVNADIQIEYSIGKRDDKGGFQEVRRTDNFRFNWNWQEGRNDFLSDKHLNGLIINSPLGKFNFLTPTALTLSDGKKVTIYPKGKTTVILLEVLNVDQNFYKYQMSIASSNNSDSPFAEPAPLYTNIKGGFGCFAAYNAVQLKLNRF